MSLFIVFCLFPSLSTFPKTFIIFSNYSFQSLVGIYFYITFALAFAFFVVFAYRNRSLEDLHRERQVVRYAVLLICFIWFCYSVKRVRGSLLFFIWDFLCSMDSGSSFWQDRRFHFSFLINDFAYTYFYNGEFDPGSGWTLATGLTHASRGVPFRELASFDDDRRMGE